MDISIVNVSSKGQIVLPAAMRKRLNIETGDKLIAYFDGDSILLKKISLPSKKDLDTIIAENIRIAQETGLTEDDIFETIREYRNERKSN